MELFTLLGKVKIDDAGIEKIDAAKSKATALSQKLDGISGNLKNYGDNMTKNVTLPILGVGAASFKLASDLSENLNKSAVVFGKNSKAVEDWSKSSLKSFGISQSTALDMVSVFGDMSTSMGLNDAQALEMSKSMVGLSGDLASFKNISIDRAQSALTGVFTGETEALKGLGIVMTQANLEAFAMSQGVKKNIKDMSQAELVQLRYQYVMANTANAQGDFSRTSDGAANQMRIFQESIKEAGASIGNELLPLLTPIIEKVNEWIQKFSSLDSGTKQFIVRAALFVAAAGPIISIVAGVVGMVATAITTFGALSGAVAAAGGVIAVLTGPIGLAVAAVAGLIAIGVALWKNWDVVTEKARVFKAMISGVTDKIKGGISKLKDFLGLQDKTSSSKSSYNDLQNEKVRVNGSHAGGLDYVPFDGYVAELHKGERVLTAEESQREDRYGVYRPEKQELVISGKLVIEGVNDDGVFVKAAEYAFDKLCNELRKGARVK